MLPRLARLCRPRRSPRPTHPRKIAASRRRKARIPARDRFAPRGSESVLALEKRLRSFSKATRSKDKSAQWESLSRGTEISNPFPSRGESGELPYCAAGSGCTAYLRPKALLPKSFVSWCIAACCPAAPTRSARGRGDDPGVSEPVQQRLLCDDAVRKGGIAPEVLMLMARAFARADFDPGRTPSPVGFVVTKGWNNLSPDLRRDTGTIVAHPHFDRVAEDRASPPLESAEAQARRRRDGAWRLRSTAVRLGLSISYDIVTQPAPGRCSWRCA